MKRTYNFGQRLVAFMLLISLFLQSCNSAFNLPMPSVQESTDNSQEFTKQLAIKQILDQELTAEGGHLVTVYEAYGKVQANIEVNPLDEKNKVYNELPVIIEQETELASLPHLPKRIQQSRIEVQFDKLGKPRGLALHKPWIMGGGKNNKGKEKAIDNEEEEENEDDSENYEGLLEHAKVDKEAEAQFLLGKRAYELWKKNVKNESAYHEALDWLEKAAGQGHEAAIALLKELEKPNLAERAATTRRPLQQGLQLDEISKGEKRTSKHKDKELDDSLITGIASLSIEEKEVQAEQEINHLLKEAEKEENVDQKVEILAKVLHLGLKSDNQEAIEYIILQANAPNLKLNIRDIVFHTLRELAYTENKKIQLEDALIKVNNAISRTYNSNIFFDILIAGIVEEDVKFLSDLQLALQNIHCTESPEYDFNKILSSAILYFAHLAIDASPHKDISLGDSSYKDIASTAFIFLSEILHNQNIILKVKVLQDIRKSLINFYNKDYKQIRIKRGVSQINGIGAVTKFRDRLKYYVPIKRDYHVDSEGESESEEDGIVYRALRAEENPSIGLFSKGQKANYGLVDHIDPLNFDFSRSNSPWISTTRSLKVAAAWTSESDCKSIAKIKIDDGWREQECDHNELGKKKMYDFTENKNLKLFFGTKTSMARNTAVSSQEVTIYREIPKENIVELYTTEIISEEKYAELKKLSQEELNKEGIHSVVKTRKQTNDKPTPRVIGIKNMEEYKARRKVELAEGSVEIVIANQANTGKDVEIQQSNELAVNLSKKFTLEQEATGKDKVIETVYEDELNDKSTCSNSTSKTCIPQSIMETEFSDNHYLSEGSTLAYFKLNHETFYNIQLELEMLESEDIVVEVIDLMHNSLGDTKAQEITFLVMKLNVRKVDLRYNDIDLDWAIDFAEHLHKCEIDIRDNDIKPADVIYLKELYPHIKWHF